MGRTGSVVSKECHGIETHQKCPDSYGTKGGWGYLTRLIGMTDYESELVDHCVAGLSLGPSCVNGSNCGKEPGCF